MPRSAIKKVASSAATAVKVAKINAGATNGAAKTAAAASDRTAKLAKESASETATIAHQSALSVARWGGAVRILGFLITAGASLYVVSKGGTAGDELSSEHADNVTELAKKYRFAEAKNKAFQTCLTTMRSNSFTFFRSYPDEIEACVRRELSDSPSNDRA